MTALHNSSNLRAAQARQRAGDFAGAEQIYRSVLERELDNVEALHALGLLRLLRGDAGGAHSLLSRTVELAPASPQFRSSLADALRQLGRCGEAIEHLQGLDTAWVAWCHREPAMTHLIQVARNNGESLGATLAGGALASDLARPVVTGFLRNALITDSGIEDFFVRVRRSLLLLALNERKRCPGGPATLDFLCALAGQCFLNEYLWDCDDAEQQSAQELKRRVEEELSKGRADPWDLALLACYLPLGDVQADTGALAAPAPAVAALLHRQIVEPRRELALRENIPQLSPVVDPVSHAVRRQYEENPYPRWLHLHRPLPDTLDRRLRRLFPHAFAQGEALPETPDILIAGCGTGRHAIQTAMAYDGARVLGIDLSLASLAYATRRTEEYQSPNVRFAQADLLEVKDNCSIAPGWSSWGSTFPIPRWLRASANAFRPSRTRCRLSSGTNSSRNIHTLSHPCTSSGQGSPARPG